MTTIEIDGKQCEAEAGQMLIEVADKHGITIPRFCYHRKLSVVANCRMCLVEIEKAPKPMPACATPVSDGMRVFTQSKKALDAQRAVMEFLLINHPLDCPICDQGGECELQDVSVGYGKDVSRFNEGKRVVKDKNIGPLVATEMTRCIHCTRCVRFGEEIAGVRELGATSRGEKMEIGTFVEHALTSEVAGNIIDLCPVGALTDKVYRFRARAWEMQRHASIAPHDCLGTNIYVHTRRDEVMRVVPRDNDDINETWIADRDRYSHQALRHADRVAKPLVKQNGEWVETDWKHALDYVCTALKGVQEKQGGEQLAAIASPNSTTEEFYLLQKLMRALGSNNIDHRAQQCDFSDQANMPAYPSLGMSIAEIEKQDGIFLLGCNVHRDVPLAGLKIRKAALAGANILLLNAIKHDVNFPAAVNEAISPQQFTRVLAGICQLLMKEQSTQLEPAVKTQIESVTPGELERAIADKLKQAEKTAILLGSTAVNHPHASEIRALVNAIAALSGSTCGEFSTGANAAGAWLAGAVPHRGPAGAASTGMTNQAALTEPRKAYVLMGVEPELDFADSAGAKHALSESDFVVALSAFRGDALNDVADVILPMAAFTETSGTFVNAEGHWQGFTGVSAPFGEARPAWKILRVLANFLKLDGFDYDSSEEVCDELQGLVEKMGDLSHQLTLNSITFPENSLTRVAQMPIYRSDALVRRATALQATSINVPAHIRVNAKTAAENNLVHAEQACVRQGENSVTLTVVVDDKVADGCLALPMGYMETAPLGGSFAAIDIIKA